MRRILCAAEGRRIYLHFYPGQIPPDGGGICCFLLWVGCAARRRGDVPCTPLKGLRPFGSPMRAMCMRIAGEKGTFTFLTRGKSRRTAAGFAGGRGERFGISCAERWAQLSAHRGRNCRFKVSVTCPSPASWAAPPPPTTVARSQFRDQKQQIPAASRRDLPRVETKVHPFPSAAHVMRCISGIPKGLRPFGGGCRGQAPPARPPGGTCCFCRTGSIF